MLIVVRDSLEGCVKLIRKYENIGSDYWQTGWKYEPAE